MPNHTSGDRGPLVDVLIIGAGPVGLTAALVLARRDLQVLVLEALHTPSSEWRASTFHPPTLQMVAGLGIANEMITQGLVADKVQLRDRADGVFAEFDYNLLQNDTDYPFRLQLEQYKYVEILGEALARHPNVQILRGHEAVAVSQSADEAEVQATTPSGTKSFSGRWLIAADGARSRIRHQVGASFEGLTYEHRYLVLSVDSPLDKLLPDLREVNYISDPEEHALVLRIPDLWRVVFSVKGDDTKAEDILSDTRAQAKLFSLFQHRFDKEIVGRQLYRVHQRVADQFVHGRVCLVGDAAHINSPMGGMGLNGGIHDAYELGEVLAAGSQATPTNVGLHEWAKRRRRVAITEIQKETHRRTLALAETDPSARKRYQAAMRATAKDPIKAREYLLRASMMGNRVP